MFYVETFIMQCPYFGGSTIGMTVKFDHHRFVKVCKYAIFRYYNMAHYNSRPWDKLVKGQLRFYTVLCCLNS